MVGEPRPRAGRGQQERPGSPLRGSEVVAALRVERRNFPGREKTQPGPEMRQERGGRSKWRRRGGARGEEGRAAGPLRASPWPGSSPAAAGKLGARGEDAGRSEQLFSLAGARRRRGGLGCWPRAKETVFFSFLSLFPLVQASSLLTGEARCAAGRAPAEVGVVPQVPARRGNRAGSFPESSPGTPRPVPPDSSGRGAEACAHLPTQLLSHRVKNGETEADGPCLEDQRPVNFCSSVSVHVGVLEAPKS